MQKTKDEVFYEYEKKIEKVSKMADFVERYEESVFHKIRFLTPQEEWEEMGNEIATKDKPFATMDYMLTTKDKELDDL